MDHNRAVNVVDPLANHNPIVAARRWLEEHDRVALATVVSTWGSAPVPVGGQIALAPGERSRARSREAASKSM
jgi:hypothetical protein